MEVKIKKQSDKLGDSFLHEEDVMADVWVNDRNVCIEVDDYLYLIPLSIIKAEEIERDLRK